MPKLTLETTPGPDLTFGSRLRDRREEKKVSAVELTRRTGINKSSLSRFENGERLPRITELRLLCEALDVSPQYLIYGEDGPEFSTIEHTLLQDGIKSDDHFVALTTVLLRALGRQDREALMQLLLSLVASKVGNDALQTIVATIERFVVLKKPEVEEALDKLFSDLDLYSEETSANSGPSNPQK